MRDEADHIFDALNEMLAVARATGVHLHISHLKLMGRAQWGKSAELLQRIHTAQAEGLTITCDQYPYDASSTTLNRLVPSWAHEGGNKAMLVRLNDPAQLDQIRTEIEEEMLRRGGSDRIRIAYTRSLLPQIEELTIAQISETWEMSAVDVVVKLLLLCDGSVGIISHSISRDDMETIMRERCIAICSDGSSFSFDPKTVSGRPHPRSFGSFPMFLETVRERRLMTLQDAVYKITGCPAKILALADRGVIKVGNIADITIFDIESIRDLTTYSNPFVKPCGIEGVFVSGEPTVLRGELTGVRNGRFIRARILKNP